MSQSQPAADTARELSPNEIAEKVGQSNPLPWLIRNLIRKQCECSGEGDTGSTDADVESPPQARPTV